jgi:hypothetical protein
MTRRRTKVVVNQNPFVTARREDAQGSRAKKAHPPDPKTCSNTLFDKLLIG